MPTSDLQRLRGRLLAFDGGEGCGKTTQIGRLTQRLTDAGLDVLAVRDPGTTKIGEMIRRILLDPDNDEMSMRCEMLLYMAARAQMMSEVIRPALEAGRIVVTDRFVSSTLAYQLTGDGLTADEIRTTARIALRDRLPDLTILLDMPAERSIERVRAKFEHRTTTLFGVETTVTIKDRIEQRPLAYHQQVRDRFLDQARHDPSYRVIGADRSPDDVAGDVWAAVQSLATE